MNRIKTLAVVSAILCALHPGAAQAALSATDLVANFPFIPTGWSPNSKTSANAGGEQYVFRGINSLGEDTFVCICEASGKSTWVRVGETSGAIRAVAYDASSRKVTIQVGSREMTLAMPKPAESASPVGVAVNSQERNRSRNLVMPPLRPGSRALNRMQRANIPPPPWMNRDANGNVQGFRPNVRWNAAGGNGGNTNTGGDSSGGNTGGNSDGNNNSGNSGDNSSSNPTNPSNPSDTTNPDNPSNPSNPDDNLDAPPPPPSGIPPIPDSIRQMIENGTSPDQPE